MDLSIVIPTYNEEKRLPPTLERIISNLKSNYTGSYEIIISDDGSEDKTVEVVQNYIKNYPFFRLLQFPENRGYGGVVRDGVLSAKGEYILATDADGSVGEEAILRFLKYMKEHPGVDMLVGSRNIEGSKILTSQPMLRVLLGNMFLFIAKIIFGWPTQDRINGFKMFRREVALDIFPYLKEDTVLGAVEVTFVCEKRGWKYELLPVFWTDYKGSKIRPFRESWRSLFGMFRILKRYKKGLYTKDHLRNK